MTEAIQLEVKLLGIREIFADDEFNCRGPIAPIDVVELAKDIEINGLMQPVVVRPMFEGDTGYSEGYRWALVAGFRRHKAHLVNGALQIPATIKKGLDEATARFLNLSENIQRKDLNVLQEALAIQKIKNLGISETECGERLHQSRGWAQVRYMLLDLPPEIQQEVASGIITQTQVRELYSILNNYGKDECFRAAKSIKEHKSSGRKGLVVDPNKRKTDTKRQRKRPEMFQMQTEIQRVIGNCFATRCMAWAAGEINTHECLEALRTEAALHDISYSIPEEF